MIDAGKINDNKHAWSEMLGNKEKTHKRDVFYNKRTRGKRGYGH